MISIHAEASLSVRFLALLSALTLGGPARVALRAQDTLRVIHQTPDQRATPSSIVTIMFDRPIAGAMDGAVPAAKVFHITPSVAGVADWRDPVTIRFVPAEPLPPGVRFTVTVDGPIRGLDGARLASRRQFAFNVSGASLLARSFDHSVFEVEQTLTPDGRIKLLYTAPVATEQLQRSARLEFTSCAVDSTRGSAPRPAPVSLRVVRQHGLTPTDPDNFRRISGYQNDSIADRFRTVVELEPAVPLPDECGGRIVLPTMADDSAYGREERFEIRTAPRFQIRGLGCLGCTGGTLLLRFASPVRRADLLRYATLDGQRVVLGGDAEIARDWTLPAKLNPRTKHGIHIDRVMRDVFGRPLEGALDATTQIDDYRPQLLYAAGVITVPRSGSHTFPLRSVNVRTVRLIAYGIPDSARRIALAVTPPIPDESFLRGLRPETTIVELPARLNVDTTFDVALPPVALAPDHPLVAVRVVAADSVLDMIPLSVSVAHHGSPLIWPDDQMRGFLRYWSRQYSGSPLLFMQVTDLAVTAKLVGVSDGAAIVTDLAAGVPRAGVSVEQIDEFGRVVGKGTTAETGVARLQRVAPDSSSAPGTPVTTTPPQRFASLQARSSDDRVMVLLGGWARAIGFSTGSPLDVDALGGRVDKAPLTSAAIFADRDIFRPGEVVHLKGVVRLGMLGDLRVPPSGDSARLVIRKGSVWGNPGTLVLRDTIIHLSSFGTLVDSMRLRPGLAVADYAADLMVVIAGKWRVIRSAGFRIAEYRAPEFAIDVTGDSIAHSIGDTISVHARAHYLFGAPMRGVLVKWSTEFFDASQGAPEWPSWYAGGRPYWWTNGMLKGAVGRSGEVRLGNDGHVRIRAPIEAAVTDEVMIRTTTAVLDLNNQAVTAWTMTHAKPSKISILARARERAPWRIGAPATIEFRAVGNRGVSVRDARIRVVVARHYFAPGDIIAGIAARPVVDTVSSAELRTVDSVTSFTFTPSQPGEYAIEMSATDSTGHPTRTFVSRPVTTETGSTPATRASPPPRRSNVYALTLKVDALPRTGFFAVGDTARIHFDSPFNDAEAWIALEREGIIEQWRRRVSSGDNQITLPITERLVPNIYVSVMLFDRSDGSRPDSAWKRVRAGYVNVVASTQPRRLKVSIAPERRSYAPRDTAAIRVNVRDYRGRGARSEVALWAVDEGVLSLTGFPTPDPLSTMYSRRGVGAELWSTLPTMLTTDPALIALFLKEEVTGLFAMATSAIAGYDGAQPRPGARQTLRNIFNSTGFYLGRFETDARGDAVAHATFPDNLTTFRVMAVAVSERDEYGSGDTTVVVTRPLVARAALPRFVRPSDSLVAGVVATAPDGRPRPITADLSTSGLTVSGPARLRVTLSADASAVARFRVAAPRRNAIGDSVSVRVGASDGSNDDAMETWLPARPDFHQRSHAVLGAVRDSQDVALLLPADIDPARSRMRLRVGTSRLSAMLAAYRWLRAYQYDNSEQLASVGRGIIAVWQATRGDSSNALGGDPHAKLQELADELSRRQTSSGAILLWRDCPWVSVWLTSYAGLFLLEARDAGVVVDPVVTRRIRDFLQPVSRAAVDTGGMNRYEQRERRLYLGERVAAVDYLRRFGEPDLATEATLLRVTRVMTWEDRLRLAELLGARADLRAAATAIVDASWRSVTVAGHRVDLPDSAHGPREFPSRVGPAARLLSASIAHRPQHPLMAALTETVLQQGRAEGAYAWTTEDYASVVMALARFSDEDAGERVVRLRGPQQRFVARTPRAGIDTTISSSLSGMLENAPGGRKILRLHVDASAGERPIYYALEVDEVPRAAPVTPDVQGIVVERWYERFDTGAPVMSVSEGDLVRVHLRITVPADRAFVAVEDPLPAGLEPIDVGLRTSSSFAPFNTPGSEQARIAGDRNRDGPLWQSWLYGSWDGGHWSPWEHKELHDDRVSYFARVLWPGSYTATYVARATTPGSFVAPPAYAEEMYNPALQGRSSGGRFEVKPRP